eukprot:gnl/MRDRNA2_/MRDRNA2_103743_c0_seq1.p1 gnl/MRDRNA2_/MRDRNA2_103743_c0~~gnl/MRDRNA2_/MRDRNA2_103743_c0_seq1.p1  ORF type:complete len:545 (+),score=100.69 gnl/MRDRNA2_/MRDRNA2_103743_c0_seq1:132-1766(+)
MAFPINQLGKEPNLVLGCQKVSGGQELHDEWNLTAQHVLNHLSSNDRTVRALDLSGMIFTMIFYEGLKTALVHNETLQQLYLDGCCITDQAARLLQQALCSSKTRVLKVLSLANNRIGSIGASCLARALCGKEWSRTFNGKRSLPFGPGKGLRQLCLAKNQIGPVGAKLLAQALSSTDDSLEELDLNENQVDDWGAGWIAMSLRNNNVLHRVDLRKNPINFEGVRELGMACELVKAQLMMDDGRTEADQDDEKDHGGGWSRQSDSSNMRVLIPGWRNLTVLVSDPQADDEVFAEEGYTDPFPVAQDQEVSPGRDQKWTVEGWSKPALSVADDGGGSNSLSSAVAALNNDHGYSASIAPQSVGLQRSHSSETYRRGGKIKKPMACWRQNWSLGIGEPASVASDSPGFRQQVGPGLASTFLESAVIPYRKDAPLDAAVASLQPKFRRCEDEKELCTLLVPSRWRWKPRHGYSPEREHGQTFVWPLPKTRFGGAQRKRPTAQRCSSAPAKRPVAEGQQDMPGAPRWSTFKIRPSQAPSNGMFAQEEH